MELAKEYDVLIVVFGMSVEFPITYQLGGQVISLNIASGGSWSKKITTLQWTPNLRQRFKLLSDE